MKLKTRYIILAVILVFALISTGCSTKQVQDPREKEPDTPKTEEPNSEPVVEPKSEPEETKNNPALVKANEAGQIMILEWHTIGEQEGRWARTYTNFRKDLEVLYEKGYRLVSLRDVVTNNIQIEAGYTPVVLTFDDGTEGHFRYIEQDGKRIKIGRASCRERV